MSDIGKGSEISPPPFLEQSEASEGREKIPPNFNFAQCESGGKVCFSGYDYTGSQTDYYYERRAF